MSIAGVSVSRVVCLRAQIEHEEVGVAALLQAHDHALAVGRKARREAHVGEIADDLALAGLDVEQIDPRLVAGRTTCR